MKKSSRVIQRKWSVMFALTCLGLVVMVDALRLRVAADEKPGTPLNLQRPAGSSAPPEEEVQDDEEETKPGGTRGNDASDLQNKVLAINELATKLHRLCSKGVSDAQLKQLCTDVCTTQSPAPHVADQVDFCGLRDPVSATAAVISDLTTAQFLAERTRLILAPRVAPKDRQINLLSMQSGLPELVASSSRVIELGLAGLAKVIEDRARREGVGWFLERMANDMCWRKAPTEAKASEELARLELTSHWFPNLCGLAEQDQMLGYGAGAAMLRALRSAIEADLKRWPGAAAGLMLSAIFRADAAPQVKNVFDCAAQSANEQQCKALSSVRGHVERLVSEMIAGAEVTEALYALGEDLHAANTEPIAAYGFSPSLDLLACVLTVPRVLRDYAEGAKLAVHELAPTALLLAALTNGTACSNLTVRGKLRGDDSGYRETATAGQVTATVERISTILRLRNRLKESKEQIELVTTQLKSASERYQANMREADNALPDLSKLRDLPMPQIKEVRDTDSARETYAAAEQYVQASTDLLQRLGTRRILQSSVETAAAALMLVRTTSRVLRSALQPDLLPGWAARHPQLCESSGCDAWKGDISPKLEQLEVEVESLQNMLDGVVPVFDQRWDRVVVHTSALLRTVGRSSSAAGELNGVLRTIGRYSGVIVAIASEQSPDDVARAIDEAAQPVGGWRRKGHASFMVTVTAHPGFFGGVEARWGVYGVTHQAGERYAVPPVLTLPVGVELSTGKDGWVFGLFLPLLDPLAYLQYDPSEDGRLPGAQISTAIALGGGLRVGLPDTPFSLMPFVVFRPAFRAWESQLAGSGANVLQLGVAATVDVTLWDLLVKP